MNAFSRKTALLTILASLAAAPAFAAEVVLVTHDEGNTGPFFAQAETRSAPEAYVNQIGLVLHDDSNSGPELNVAHPASHPAHAAAQGKVQVVARDDGQTAPQVIIR